MDCTPLKEMLSTYSEFYNIGLHDHLKMHKQSMVIYLAFVKRQLWIWDYLQMKIKAHIICEM